MSRYVLSICVLLAATVLSVEGGGDAPNDDLILGHYKLISDLKAQDLDDLLKAMEFSDDMREKIRNCPSLEGAMEKSPSTQLYSFKVIAGPLVKSESFKLGEEYDAELLDGRKYKATVTITGDTLTRMEKHNGFEAKSVVVFRKDGFEVTYTAKEKTAVLKFKRT